MIKIFAKYKNYFIMSLFVFVCLIGMAGFITMPTQQSQNQQNEIVQAAAPEGGFLSNTWFTEVQNATALKGVLLEKTAIRNIYLGSTQPTTYFSVAEVATKDADGAEYDGTTPSIKAYLVENGSSYYDIHIICSSLIYAPTDCDYLFAQFENVLEIDLTNFDTRNAKDMNHMFYYNISMTTLDVSNFDTFGVHNYRGMFSYCRYVKTLDVSGFITSLGTDFGYMFQFCQSITTLDVSDFDVKNARQLEGMFYNIAKVETLDISNFKTDQALSMSEMFYACSKLKSLDISHFVTKNVTSMKAMFYRSTVKTLDVSNFDTSKVTNMKEMFRGCSGLTTIDVSNFNTSKVTTMESMFSECGNLETLDVSNFDTSNVSDMKGMFGYCYKLKSLDLTSFNTSKITKTSLMFYDCTALEYLDLSTFNLANVDFAGNLFGNARSILEIKLPYNVNVDLGLGSNFYNKETGAGPYTVINSTNCSTAEKTVTFVKSFNINFNLNGGTTDNGIQGYKYNSDQEQTFELKEPVKTGSNFDNWEITTNTTPNSNININTLKIPAKAKGPLAIKANYSDIEYTITFDTDGGTVIEVKKFKASDSDQTITLTVPEKTGSTFKNWAVLTNTTPEATITDTQIVIPANAVGDISLKAVYEAENYKIIYDLSDGTLNSNNTEKYYYADSVNNIVLNAPVKKGYNFTGWTITSNSTPSATINSNNLSIPASAKGNINLQANYEIADYTITFDTNGGNVINSVSYNISNTDQTVQLTNASKNNAEFSGWQITTNSDIESTVNGNVLTIPAQAVGNIVLTAKYFAFNEYAIEFDLQGGEIADHLKDLTYTSSTSQQTKTLSNPTRKGYIFKYWAITTNTTPQSTVYASTLTIPAQATGKIVIKAYYEKDIYTISYDVNGGTIGNQYIVKNYSISDTQQTINLIMPTKRGYSFDKWELVTVFEENQPFIDDNKMYIFANTVGNIRIVASYKINEYKIKFDTNGGTSLNDINYSISKNDQEFEVLETTKLKHKFLRWSITQTDTEVQAYLSDNVLTVPANAIGDIVLKAEWIRTYTIYFDLNTVDSDNNPLPNTPTIDVEEMEYISGNPFGKLPTPRLGGYKFIGWYLDAELTELMGETSILQTEQDFTLYAKWQKENDNTLLIIIIVIFLIIIIVLTIMSFVRKKF